MIRYRNRVLGLLSLLMVITYLDRVCISVAGPRMQAALHIGPVGWGWITGIFTLSYAIFEIPSGALGDRIGPRRVLTRIVLWWSAFTSLTGLATGLNTLLVARFFFGAGEAGAYPNASIAIARWFPVPERGRAFGVIIMSTQIGGTLAPLLVVPIMARYGWRACFYIFGVVGVIWCVAWFRWFRDSPREKAGISAAELAETRGLIPKANHGLPWKIALRSANLWAMLMVAFCYVYTFTFFQSWFHTYLVKARGFSENDLLLSSLPFVVAGCSSLLGGLASNTLVKRVGLKWGRRSIGIAGLSLSAVCATAVLVTQQPMLALVLLSLVYSGITFQQPVVFAACLDMGGEYAGAVVGAMNTTSQIGGFIASLAFGYIVDRFGSYNLPFVPMIALLLVGVALWFRVDATERLIPAPMEVL